MCLSLYLLNSKTKIKQIKTLQTNKKTKNHTVNLPVQMQDTNGDELSKRNPETWTINSAQKFRL